MRVVFMGTPEFAVPSLRALAREHEVAAVYTRPDAVSGRGRQLRRSPVAEAAIELGFPLVQPATLRDTAVQHQLRDFAPDIIVVAAYGMILPVEVLEIPPLGCVNVHASLLPRWRGAAPIQRAILAGDDVTGVAIMQMEVGLDTGPYCTAASTPVAEKTTQQLTTELAKIGAKLLIDALPAIADGSCTWTPQDAHQVTYADKIDKSAVALSPELSVAEAIRRVRASSPQAPARALIADKGVTVIQASPASASLEPGRVECGKRSLLLGFSDGVISLDNVKPDGKGEMAGCDWSRGARVATGETWSAAS